MAINSLLILDTEMQNMFESLLYISLKDLLSATVCEVFLSCSSIFSHTSTRDYYVFVEELSIGQLHEGGRSLSK